MKKIFLAVMIVAILAFSQAAWAVEIFNMNGLVFTKSYSLLSAVTATGTSGSAKTFSMIGDNLCRTGNLLSEMCIPLEKHMCTATLVSVPSATNMVFSIDLSEDGTNYSTPYTVYSGATVTMTSSSAEIWIEKATRYIRATPLVYTGASTTWTFSVSCTSMH